MVYKLNDSQLKQLAESTSNLSLIFMAGVISPLLSGFKNVNLLGSLIGLISAVICLSFSMYLLRKVKK